jgi:hypothetical protein
MRLESMVIGSYLIHHHYSKSFGKTKKGSSKPGRIYKYMVQYMESSPPLLIALC